MYSHVPSCLCLKSSLATTLSETTSAKVRVKYTPEHYFGVRDIALAFAYLGIAPPRDPPS
jgi:hypothetical protein